MRRPHLFSLGWVLVSERTRIEGQPYKAKLPVHALGGVGNREWERSAAAEAGSATQACLEPNTRGGEHISLVSRLALIEPSPPRVSVQIPIPSGSGGLVRRRHRFQEPLGYDLALLELLHQLSTTLQCQDPERRRQLLFAIIPASRDHL